LLQNWDLIAGIHTMYRHFSREFAPEPRIGTRYAVNARHSLHLGFGMHHQQQSVATTYAMHTDSSGFVSFPNMNLRFSKSVHYVLGHSFLINENMQLKTEIYLQNISRVPVSALNENISLLNFTFTENAFLNEKYVNEGKGRNYGIEITLERYFAKRFYFLTTASLFRSIYIGKDGRELSTRYDGRYALHFLLGREFVFGKNKNYVCGINIKVINIGGQKYSAIDLQASKLNGYAIYDESQYFENKFPAFFKVDSKLRLRMNRKKASHELWFEIANVFNRSNIESMYYDHRLMDIRYTYQLNRIPVAAYTLYF